MPDRHSIDPVLRQLLDEQAAAAPDFAALSDPERVEAQRDALRRALAQRDAIAGLPNAVHTRNLTVADTLAARLYTPPGSGKELKPLLIFLHGGGWVAGSLETHDPFCCLLAATADLLLLSINYRRAPEHPFPAALDDAVAAVRWAAAHTGELHADPHRLALGGDSAGGNLAAAALNLLAASLEDKTTPRLQAQLLLFPVTDHPSANHPSYTENATGYGLTAEAMRWYWHQYASAADPGDPRLSPLRAQSLPQLPPTLVFTAEYDVLRDEGRAYADKLRAAGVMTTHRHAPDMTHDFPVSPLTVARFPQCLTALNELAGWLRAVLHTPLPGSYQASHSPTSPAK